MAGTIKAINRKRRRFFIADVDLLEICVELAGPLANYQNSNKAPGEEQAKPVTSGVCKAGAAVLGWAEERTNWILNHKIRDVTTAFEEAQAALNGDDSGQLWYPASFKDISETSFFGFFARSTVINAIYFVSSCGFLERRLPGADAAPAEPCFYRLRTDRLAKAIELVRGRRLASEWDFSSLTSPIDQARLPIDSPSPEIDGVGPSTDSGGLEVDPGLDRRQSGVGLPLVGDGAAGSTPIYERTVDQEESKGEQALLAIGDLQDRATELCNLLAELVTNRTRIRTRPDQVWLASAKEMLSDCLDPSILPALIHYSQRGDYWPSRIITMPDFAANLSRLAGEFQIDECGVAMGSDLDMDVA